MIFRLFAVFFVFLVLFSASVQAQIQLQQSEYSYEKSEEYFHLIDWKEYSQETFDLAKRENKPVFLVLSAVWCYWCHVYESPDFLYHESVYPYINEHFIPIFVDADKRQDLTRKYLEGGWPSTTIMTPTKERITGFSGARPPQNLLENLKNVVAFMEESGFAEETIEIDYERVSPKIPSEDSVRRIVSGYPSFILNAYDSQYGGFGTGQKFPQGLTLDYLLDVYEQTGNAEFLNSVASTFDNQYTKIEEMGSNYNLYDPLEGGFHRYGVQRDWTPPHYEKMLKDNARLIMAYAHLFKISKNPLHKNVVQKSVDYVLRDLYDQNLGVFYGSADADEEYYPMQMSERIQRGKPFIDETIYTEWNSEMIVTMFVLYEILDDTTYNDIGTKALDFYSSRLENGAFHYFDGEAKIRGQLLDNSWLLLAFIKGYETTSNPEYLDAAKKIADFSLDNLYDWHAGGFFERNSKDTEAYTRDELLDLGKPSAENGVMTLALLKLYGITGDLRYLNSGIKTFGFNLDRIAYLDRGYHMVKASEFILESDLLADYQNNLEEISNIEDEGRKTFFIDALIEQQKNPPVTGQAVSFQLSNQGLTSLPQNLFVLVLIVLIAGLFSFLSPCTLPVIPAYFATTFKSERRKVTRMSLLFFLGLAIVFSILGILAGLAGGFLTANRFLLSQGVGLVVITFGILILMGKGFSGIKIRQKPPTSSFGSFLFGMGFAVGWSACIGPVLFAVLALAAAASTALTGGLLLFFYALGLSIPLMILSVYFDKIPQEHRIWKLLNGRRITKNIFGKEFSFHSTNNPRPKGRGGSANPTTSLTGLDFWSTPGNRFLPSVWSGSALYRT